MCIRMYFSKNTTMEIIAPSLYLGGTERVKLITFQIFIIFITVVTVINIIISCSRN